jgi:hypothetical protein
MKSVMSLLSQRGFRNVEGDELFSESFLSCKRNAYTILVGKHEGKISLGSCSIYEKIILKWILKKQNERLRTGFV